MDSYLKSRWAAYVKRHTKKGFTGELISPILLSSTIGEKEICVYCGDVASLIDRVDNSIGYVEGNCVPACSTCNRIKGVMSVEELKSHMSKMLMYIN